MQLSILSPNWFIHFDIFITTSNIIIYERERFLFSVGNHEHKPGTSGSSPFHLADNSSKSDFFKCSTLNVAEIEPIALTHVFKMSNIFRPKIFDLLKFHLARQTLSIGQLILHQHTQIISKFLESFQSLCQKCENEWMGNAAISFYICVVFCIFNTMLLYYFQWL